MQIQSPAAESPLTGMSICALEVGASGFDGSRNVPAAAALIGDKRKGKKAMEVGNEGGIMGDGGEAVRAGG